ncbi:hypothetical protein AVEN_139509-1 [Araneus ventricosus]|uniref:Uncharacterized protein n=1 Tax=Araneus ventricosus TaxID=182803 RepID=A0A4Y2IE58_ARAVE|nr:hypothetical protein AVEN_139509-1 [Araneus ventricosus]
MGLDGAGCEFVCVRVLTILVLELGLCSPCPRLSVQRSSFVLGSFFPLRPVRTLHPEHHTRGRTYDPLTYDLTCNRPNTQRIVGGIGDETWNPLAPEPTTYHAAHASIQRDYEFEVLVRITVDNRIDIVKYIKSECM